MNEILEPEMTREEQRYISQMKPWQLLVCEILSSLFSVIWLLFFAINKLVNLIVDLILKLFKS